MPEPPDFDRLAREVLEGRLTSDIGDGTGGTHLDEAWWRTVRQDLAEQLRLIWNARGAADLAIFIEDLNPAMQGPFLQALGDELVSTFRVALRSLDR